MQQNLEQKLKEIAEPEKKEALKKNINIKRAAAIGAAVILIGAAAVGIYYSTIEDPSSYRKRLVSLMEDSSKSSEEKLKEIARIKSKIEKSNDSNLVTMANSVEEDTLTKYKNRAAFEEVDEKRSADQNFEKIKKQFGEKKYQGAYSSLQSFMESLKEKSKYNFASAKRIEALDWKEKIFLPEWINEQINALKNVNASNYLAVKKSIDDLSKLAKSEDFSNKNNYLAQINSLHRAGIKIEEEKLAFFAGRFADIKNIAAQGNYRGADSETVSLINDLRNYGFAYKPEEIISLISQAESYRTKTTKPEIERIESIKRNLAKRFSNYEALLKRKEISDSMDISKYDSGESFAKAYELAKPYIDADKELENIIGDSGTSGEEKDNIDLARKYHAEIHGKCSIIANKIWEDINNKMEKIGDLMDDSKVTDERKRVESKKIAASLHKKSLELQGSALAKYHR